MEYQKPKNDRLEDLSYKMTLIEYEQLEKLCKDYLFNNVKISSKKILNYKFANKSKTTQQQIEILNKFELWKKNIV